MKCNSVMLKTGGNMCGNIENIGFVSNHLYDEVFHDVKKFVVYKFRSMKKALDFAQYGIRINQIGTIVASIKHQFHGFFLSDRLIAAP